MLPLGEVLNSLIKSFGLEKQLRIAKALELWEEVAGPEVASKTRALRFRNGGVSGGSAIPGLGATTIFAAAQIM